MNNIEIRFQSPWLLLVLLPAAGALLLSHARLPRALRKDAAQRLCLALRLFSAALLTLLIAGMTVVSDSAGKALMILADGSDSLGESRQAVREAAQSLAAAAAERGYTVSIAAFGGDSALDAPDEGTVDAGATDIAQALRFARRTLPDTHARRVALLSDGLATDGDALSAAVALGGQGIRVDALNFDGATDAAEVQLSGLSLPGAAALGQPFSFGVRVRSNMSGRATLRLYDEDTLLKEVAVGVFEGENAFAYPVTPKTAGARVFSAELVMAGDTRPENNRAYGALTVSGSDAVLLVEGEAGQGDALYALLTQNGYETARVPAGEMPGALAALCEYSLVVLMNADVRSLPAGAPALLRDYVSVYGRSVLTTGGDNTYLLGGMQETAFEEFLPVTMVVQDQESAQPTALLLLIDNSASMEGTAIVMAKRGAVKSIQALNDNDFVGVITFSTEHDMLAPLTSAAERSGVISAVSRIGTVMGTMYTGALREAYDQLAAFDQAERKHVILLSDGNPSDTGYEQIVRDMAAAGITVSAIAMGREVSAEIMENIALLGGGSCYVVESSYDLPSIMMTDTVRLQVEYAVEEAFAPAVGRRLIDFPQPLPPLAGYNRVSAKPTADVLLLAPGERALYAQWTHGEGMAASFMSDLGGAWAQAWFDDANGRAAILAMIEELMPPAGGNAAITAQLAHGGSTGTLCVQSADAQLAQSFTAGITPPAGEPYSLSLAPAGEGVYEATLPLAGPGKYAVALRQFDASGALLRTVETAVAASWSPEYEAFERGNGAALLAQVCEAAGGGVMADAQALLAAEPAVFRVTRDPGLLFSLLVFAAVMADLTLRKTGLGRLLARRRARRG